MHTPSDDIAVKMAVLADLETLVGELMEIHEYKRVLWFPSELLAPPPDTDPLRHVATLRACARYPRRSTRGGGAQSSH